MASTRVVIAGGGAAGVFAAIACAEAGCRDVTVFERGPQLLSKVRISGGGRCNVTHACFDARDFTTRYPRGEQELISPYRQFQASDTVAWFESRGVKLKTEADGRMFPVTDNSQTIVDCLLGEAQRLGVKSVVRRGIDSVQRRDGGGFTLILAGDENVECDRLLLATGGCRTPALGGLATSLGHTLAPPVPSLFTFHIEAPWLRALAGVSVQNVEATVPGTALRERGPLLVTHWGLSGPVILRLSAWGARELNARNYHFPLHINWRPDVGAAELGSELKALCEKHPARQLASVSVPGLPIRLWERLLMAAGIEPHIRCAQLSNAMRHQLVSVLSRTELAVTDKSLNKEEFVTCGGVRLEEINFKTMESRLCPGLYFAGELLDIDGITGGFNFQAAWTTGWLAGRAMAQ